WPVYQEKFEAEDANAEMRQLMDIIRAVRNIRAEVNVSMGKKIELLIKPTDAAVLALLEKNIDYVKRFSNTSSLEMALDIATPDKAMTAIVTGAELYFPLAGLIDISQEITRLEKELKVLYSEVERIEKKLANEGFVSKAPAKVIDEEKAKLEDYANKRDKVIARIAELKG